MTKILYDYETDVLTIQKTSGKTKVIERAFEKNLKEMITDEKVIRQLAEQFMPNILKRLNGIVKER